MNILKGNQLNFGLTPLFVTFSVASRQFLGRLSPFLLETDQIYKLMWLKIHTHKARLFSNNVLTKTRSIALWRCIGPLPTHHPCLLFLHLFSFVIYSYERNDTPHWVHRHWPKMCAFFRTSISLEIKSSSFV